MAEDKVKSIKVPVLSKRRSRPRDESVWVFNKDKFKNFRKKCEGKKLVIALSSGKLKFACHLPLLRLIETLELEVDEIWGSSAGAVVGGLWSNGMTVQEMDKILDDVNLTLIYDIFNLQAIKTAIESHRQEQPLRTAGIFPGIRIEKYLRTLLEETKKPNPLMDITRFYSIAYNISKFYRTALRMTKDSRVHHINFMNYEILNEKVTDGDLADIIRASMAMPGIYWPEEIGDELFLDGGMAEQLPIRSPFIMWENDVRSGKEKRDLLLIGMQLVYATSDAPPPANPLSMVAEAFEWMGDEIARDHQYYIVDYDSDGGPKVELIVIKPKVPYTLLTEVPNFARQIEISKDAIIKVLADK